jgi:hypothetical protein
MRRLHIPHSRPTAATPVLLTIVTNVSGGWNTCTVGQSTSGVQSYLNCGGTMALMTWEMGSAWNAHCHPIGRSE